MVTVITHTTTKVPDWHEPYGRMIRWHKKFTSLTKVRKVVDTIAANDVANAFFLYCYQLKDWIKADDDIGTDLKEGLEEAINDNDDMVLCDCLATGAKHKTVRVNARRQKIKSIELKPVIAMTLVADNKNKSTGQYQWRVIVNGNETIDGIDLANRCVKFWKDYLKSEQV